MALKHDRNLTIVGAGAVGSAFGVALAKRGYKVVSVISSSRASALRLSKKVRCKISGSSVAHIHPETDLLIIAVPDSDVASVAKDISSQTALRWKNLSVFHSSGLLTSDALAPLKKNGGQTFSLHPIQSFPQRGSVSSLKGISFGFEGDRRAATIAKQIVKELHGEFLNVPKEAKVLYHCACVIASNYPVVLLNVVDELARRTLKPNSLYHFRALTETSLRNAFESNPRAALTGPIARGDVQTVRAHLQALMKSNRVVVGLYRELGLAAARMVRANGKVSSKRLQELQQLLSTEYEHLTY